MPEQGTGAHLMVVPDRASTPGNDDADLARALLARAPGAPEAAWRRYGPLVFRLFQRALGPMHDVEDLTQEVFLRFFSRIRALKDPAALRSYIYSIAIRVLRWELRRHRLRRAIRLSDSGILPEPPPLPPDPEAREALVRFYKLLDRLAPATRAVFVLRQMEGMSTEDIASTMGVSPATAKRRLRAALDLVNRLVERDPALSAYAQTIMARG